VLVTVRTDDSRTEQVCDVLDAHNAVDVDDRVRNWRERGWDGYRDDAKPFEADELRQERGYYNTTGTLTGMSGIGVDRERSNLSRDRDDLSPRVGNTPGSNAAGDVGTSGVVGTTGLSGAGLSAGHSTPEVTGDRGWDTGSTRRHDDRSLTEKAGDKMREWKEDVKESGRELRDEGRDRDRNMSTWADETRGSYEDGTRTSPGLSESMREGGRDVKEAGRDTRDFLTGRTDPQAHDYVENRREEMRDSRRSDVRSGASDMAHEAGRDLKEAGRDVNDALHGRTGEQPHDRMEDRREAERRRRSRVYDRTVL